jgi:hypothetical protein
MHVRFGSKPDIAVLIHVRFYPRKRTLLSVIGMSALCQSRTLIDYSITSSARPRRRAEQSGAIR